jgi:predicted metalloprotease
MRWTPGGKSGDIIDRRGARGLGTGMRVGIGGAVVLLVLSLVTGRDLLTPVMGGAGGAETGMTPAGEAAPVETSPEEERMVQFMSFVLDDAQNTWERVFAERGAQYQRARMVLFRDATQSACGVGQSAMGPFYCPADDQVYLDLSFFGELSRRFGAPGDFAQAYVVAHELGHHVQDLLGTEAQMREAQQRRPDLANELSVRLELQADCYAGIWGHSTAQRELLERGDVEEGLDAAAAVGDDAIQRSSGQGVHPESFTHGSSEQRMQWFRRGLETGRLESCDTFQ